jgi:hypothetical protein
VKSRIPIRACCQRLSPLPFLPDAVFAGSFTLEAASAPIFEPQIDPSVPNGDVVSLFGSVDAPYTILRLAVASAPVRAVPTTTSAAT